MLRELLGSLVWLAANGLYIDFRRKGRRGWARFFFFWMGIPATWLWLFLVREGKEPLLDLPGDDFDGLLDEIRRDKALRAGDGDTGGRPSLAGRGDRSISEEGEGAAPDRDHTLPL